MDLLKVVRKIADNKKLFYSHRINSIQSMREFYELIENENGREEIIQSLGTNIE